MPGATEHMLVVHMGCQQRVVVLAASFVSDDEWDGRGCREVGEAAPPFRCPEPNQTITDIALSRLAERSGPHCVRTRAGYDSLVGLGLARIRCSKRGQMDTISRTVMLLAGMMETRRNSK